VTYLLDPVTDSRSEDFDRAHALLAAEFGPRGELERREVLAGWVDEKQPVPAGRLQRQYHLLLARNEHGELCGVRDCHVIVDPESALAVVYLAHALVLPRYRRTGLGVLLREHPLSLAKRALEKISAPAEVLLAAEMEPHDPADLSSMVRLIAYGKEGFRAIAPEYLPYAQPDFRDLGQPDSALARPIPLLAVVRWVGRETAERLPGRLARAFVEHLYAVFATHVGTEQLGALKQRTLSVLDASPGSEVPLLALPQSTDDIRRAAPLARQRVLQHHGGGTW